MNARSKKTALLSFALIVFALRCNGPTAQSGASAYELQQFRTGWTVSGSF